MMSLALRNLLILSTCILMISCSTSSFTYNAANELDLSKIQFYLKLNGKKMAVIGGPVYHKITSTTKKEKLKDTEDGTGSYTEITTKLVQEDAIRIPLGTPGVLHRKKNRKTIEVDFGEGIILEFKCSSPKNFPYFFLNTDEIEVDGESYSYDKGGGGWSLGNYVLDADIDMNLYEKEIENSNTREIEGKTLK